VTSPQRPHSPLPEPPAGESGDDDLDELFETAIPVIGELHPDEAAARPWRDHIPRGRGLVLAGILLVGLNLRPAVTSLTPVLVDVRDDFPLGATATGILGALPELCFAVIGVLTPAIARRIGLERTVVAAMGLIVIGQLTRALATDAVALLILSAVAMAGMALGNVALPPLVKRYFPDHIGAVTGLYTLLLSAGTALPPLLAVPISDAHGWRTSTGSWAVLGLIAAIPWIITLRRAHLENSPVHVPHQRVPVWRTPVAWGIAVFLGCTGMSTYVLFAWLPTLLTESGSSPASAGSMLSLYAAVGIPAALIVPPVTARLHNPFPLVLLFLTFFVSGYLGLLLTPQHLTALWVVLAGLGPAAFPMCLTLVNLRTATHAGASQLSGFTQGVGYGIASTGPIAFGALRDLTGGYRAGFAMLGCNLLVWLVAGWIACKPDTVEAALARRGHPEIHDG
jgi:CP family cyanate transporter-like MFS transporter